MAIVIILVLGYISARRLFQRGSVSFNEHTLKGNCTTCSNLTEMSQETEGSTETSANTLSMASSTLRFIGQNSTISTISPQFEPTLSPKRKAMDLCASARWSTYPKTVAGGKGPGSGLDQLNSPRGAFVDDAGAIYITDDNLRVVKWTRGATQGVMVAGFGGRGSNTDQFEFYLHNLAVNQQGTMFICDKGNTRVMRWAEHARNGEVILSDINCFGVTLDDEESLYVSNIDEDLIIRYRKDASRSEIVAGGHGRGVGLNQLNRPHFPFVDHHFNLYVPDTSNHRIMKWPFNSKEGIVVSEEESLQQLSGPHALVVDQMETIYTVDHDLHKVIRWFKGASSGELLFGGHGFGNSANQFAHPVDIDFDREGNLYVTDRNNHRIQLFTVNKSSCVPFLSHGHGI